MFLVARTGAADPSSFLPVIRKTVALIDPEAPVFEGGTMAGLVRRSTAPRRLSAGIAIGLTAAALLLALVGIYAATSISVSERTHEVGLRIALGASRWDALRLVLREGAITAVMGLIPGVACAIFAARLVDAQLFSAGSTDAAWVIPAIALVLLAAAIAAVVPPARRAARLDPLVAMRRD
jgi:putative ABC transport system permease protein